MVLDGYRLGIIGLVVIFLPSGHLQTMLPCVGNSVVFVALSSTPMNCPFCPGAHLTSVQGSKSVNIGAGLRAMSMNATFASSCWLVLNMSTNPVIVRNAKIPSWTSDLFCFISMLVFVLLRTLAGFHLGICSAGFL